MDVTTTRRVGRRGSSSTARRCSMRATSRPARVRTTTWNARSWISRRPAADRLRGLSAKSTGLGRLERHGARAALSGQGRQASAAAKALRAASRQRERLATSLTRSELEDRSSPSSMPRRPAQAIREPPHQGMQSRRRMDRASGSPSSWTAGLHHDRGAFETDRARTGASSGLDGRRFTHADVVDRPGDVADTLRSLLAR